MAFSNSAFTAAGKLSDTVSLFTIFSKSLSAQMLSADRSVLWQAALLLFQIEEKRSCFYVYGRRLSSLNRFLSYRCDFPFPSTDGFCRFGNDMFSFFRHFTFCFWGNTAPFRMKGLQKDLCVFVRFFRADTFHTAEFLFGCRTGFCDPTEDCIGKNL